MRIAMAITLLRVGLGLEFMTWALDKTRSGWLTDGAVLADILRDQASRSPGAYGEFLSGVVLPNVLLFSRLVTLGEWSAGLSLALGLLTPAGAAVGMWLTVNFMAMRGVFGVEASIDRMFFLACLVSLLCARNSKWAVDNYLPAVRFATIPWPGRAAIPSHFHQSHLQ
jgi:uncharacterized membrane protein YphA (DoxX/SURF4 family)